MRIAFIPSCRSFSRGLALIAVLTAALATAEPKTVVPVGPTNAKMHEQFVQQAKAGNIDVLFLGDSITDFWRSTGKDVWNRNFAPLKGANFGISGDSTQGLLWRLRNGELDGIQPKVVVLMIGTNNGGDSPAEVALGIQANIAEIHSRCPPARVLLLGIFPRGEKPNPHRAKNDATNQIISGYADAKTVFYLDIGSVFLTPDQGMTKDNTWDYIHPNPKGYELWAQAILDPVKTLLSGKPLPGAKPEPKK